MRTDMRSIEETDISTAWAKALLDILAPGVTEISPLVVTVTLNGSAAFERSDIRVLLDECIDGFRRSGDQELMKVQPVNTVANTVFPSSFWNRNAEKNAELLFERFERAWPRLQKCTHNRRGSYFRRMTSFRPKAEGDTPVNQLKHVIETYRNRDNHRRSALQASIFDPALDHNHSNRGMGFPCLHQVSFAPIATNGLAITGFYATQYIVDRAYGNYLGLCRLGEFMAQQLGLKLAKMICIASVAQRGRPNKGQLQNLMNKLTPLISDTEESSE